MKDKQFIRHRILAVVALIFLFCTRWMYYRLEIDPQINTILFAAEGLLFVMNYGLWLFHAPTELTLTAAAAGFVGLCFLEGAYYGYEFPRFLQSLAFFPPFLFLTAVTVIEKKGRRSLFVSVLEYLCPIVLIWLSLSVSSIRDPSSLKFLFSMFLSVAVAAVYVLIMRTPVKKEKNKKTADYDPVQSMRASFRRAVASIICSVLFLALCRRYSSAYTLVILWIADLLFLFDEKNRIMIAFADRTNKKEDAFFQNDAAG